MPMHFVGLMGMPRRVYTYEAGQGWDVYNLISTIGAFVLFSGIIVFGINLVYTHFRGQPAGNNPWGGDSLEWSVSSPPPDQGYSVPPIVHSRHPLWDQDDLHTGDRAHGRPARRPRPVAADVARRARHEHQPRRAGGGHPGLRPVDLAVPRGVRHGAVLHRRDDPPAVAARARGASPSSSPSCMWNRPEPVPTTDAEEEAFEQRAPHRRAHRRRALARRVGHGAGPPRRRDRLLDPAALLLLPAHREPAVAARRRRRTRR